MNLLNPTVSDECLNDLPIHSSEAGVKGNLQPI